MLIPDNIRELAYDHIKNYNHRDYKDYMLTVISNKVISFCNKEEAIEYINSLDNKEEYLKRLSNEDKLTSNIIGRLPEDASVMLLSGKCVKVSELKPFDTVIVYDPFDATKEIDTIEIKETCTSISIRDLNVKKVD